MANTAIHGRVLDEQGAGIAGLTVRALDFDPFFNKDDVLGAGKTEGDGTFLISYSPDAYRSWKADRNPDLVVQIFGPPHAEPKLFGTRLLHETPEAEDVTDSTHEVSTITIHRKNIEGWLVTHTTLNAAVEDVTAPGVTGGYRDFNPRRAEYTGLLQLELADRVAVKAIRLLPTRLPEAARAILF